MASIGKINRLRLVRQAPPGAYLDGEELGEILLPRRYVSHSAAPGELLEVFVYRDSEDRLVATTEVPLATVGDFACLKVLTVNRQIGAFLDWGLGNSIGCGSIRNLSPHDAPGGMAAPRPGEKNGGREWESNPLGAEIGPSPDLKSGRATGHGSLP